MSSPAFPPALAPAWDEYLWIVVCGGLAAFYMAWGIGANDVANSFATSVGSKTLKLWQACIIAGIFEFLGAMVLGGETTKTIASDIANVNMFKDAPEMYMYGMLTSLTVAGTWLMVATYWCLAVSTTHSIIGAIMGFALVYGGWNGVLWNQEIGNFPYTKGFLPIVLSWFFSPIIGGVLSSIIFALNRVCVLRRKNSAYLAIWSLPVLLFVTFFINMMFVLAKGAKQDMQKQWPCTTSIGYHNLSYTDCSALNNAAAWIAACCGVFAAVVGGAIFIPILRMRLRKDIEASEAAATTVSDTEAGDPKSAVKLDLETSSAEELEPQRYEKIKVHEIPKDARFFTLPYHYTWMVCTAFARQCVKGLFYEVHNHGGDDELVNSIHNSAEVFDVHTEKIYQYLQVFTACCVSFAHGSNDVANSIGPFSAIYTTYETYAVPTGSTPTEKWIFVFGGVGIVIGLITYGYNIIMQLGVQLLKLTPSRGYCCELGAGLTISLASFYGIPVSTTQIIVGCEMGVGLTENVRTGLNFPIVARTFMGWIWTILLALAFNAALFSAGAYAPSIVMLNDLRDLRSSMYYAGNSAYTQMTAKNLQYKSNAAWMNGTNVTMNGTQLNALITKNAEAFKRAVFEYDSAKKKYTGLKKYVHSGAVGFYMNQALDLMNQTSKSTIGTY